jgi:hypothetical protein
MNKLQQMQYDFRVAVAAYVQEFCNKHDWVYNPADWVAGDVGGVIEINDMFINFDDIRVDIDNEFDLYSLQNKPDSLSANAEC